MNTLIVRDWHLHKGDKVRVGDEIYEYIKMDGMYAQWLNKNNEIAIGNFNFLTYDGEYYIPYSPNKE